MFRSIAVAIAALVVSAGAVSAQPWATAPAPIWSGLYLGGHGGGGWGEFDGELDDVSGALGGIHGGYQWQRGNFVFGAEGDFTFGQLEDGVEIINRGNFFGTPFVETTRLDVNVDKLASLRGRIGYAAGSLHVFATGGVAWSWVELALFDSLTSGGRTLVSDNVKADDVMVGWTVGGGIEYKFWKNVSARLDVQHYSFDDTFDFNGTPVNDVELDLTVVRGGLTFHLN